MAHHRLIPFNLIAEDGTELEKGQQSGPFQIGARYNIGGKCWITADILGPFFSNTDGRWTIIVKPEKIIPV